MREEVSKFIQNVMISKGGIWKMMKKQTQKFVSLARNEEMLKWRKTEDGENVPEDAV